MANYDEYYQTEDLFGDSYPELIDFFKNHAPKGKLIDVGCGQGRDAIPLARLGYSVTGIDISKVGINQMLKKSNNEKLAINGIVGDIYSFNNYQKFDIILLNSMFHFEKRDKERETNFIKKIANQIQKNAVICICIQDTGKKVKILKDTINETGIDFKILDDSSLIYNFEDQESGHKSKTKYCMYIIKKK